MGAVEPVVNGAKEPLFIGSGIDTELVGRVAEVGLQLTVEPTFDEVARCGIVEEIVKTRGRGIGDRSVLGLGVVLRLCRVILLRVVVRLARRLA